MMRRKKTSQKFELFFERKRRRRQSFETFGQLAAGDYTNALHSFKQTDGDDDDDNGDDGDDDDDFGS